ncbi:MAG: hypothetical protein VYB50_01385 [Candidatus Thermoplasmatota archaeon]|nr:hypothetical protein [Candidatus Thermoplasmatota archaeon]
MITNMKNNIWPDEIRRNLEMKQKNTGMSFEEVSSDFLKYLATEIAHPILDPDQEEIELLVDLSFGYALPVGTESRAVTIILSEKEMSKIPEDKRNHPVLLRDYTTDCFSFGNDAFYRAKTVQDTSYVDSAISSALYAFKRDAESIPSQIRDELVKIVGIDDGQVLEPIFSGLTSISTNIDGKVIILNDSLNLDSKTSLLSIAFDEVNNMLDPNTDGSIQHTLNQAISNIAEEDGTLANLLQDKINSVLETRIGPLVDICKTIDTYIKIKDGVEQAESNSPKKGASHEENVHSLAKKWVQSHGGSALHSGGDNNPGDHVLEVPMPNGTPMRIVIESKDESTARGSKWISDKLFASMELRKCTTGLWISKTENGLSTTQIGNWGLGNNALGGWLATTVDNTSTALTYLRAMEIINRAKAIDSEVDIDFKQLQEVCETIKNNVKKVQNIRTMAGQIINNASQINTEADDLRSQINADVTKIESMIKIAISDKKEK